jgi:hypothetical protein
MLAISADNTVEWDGMTDPAGAFLNAATVTCEVKDESGSIIATGITLAYVSASDGIYRGTIPSTTSLTEKQTYYVEVTAVEGTDNGFRRIKERAEYRESN